MTTEAQRWQALKGWGVEFGIALAIYLIAWAAAIWATVSLPAGVPRTALIIAPIAPGLFLIWNAVRWYSRCDEFVRLRILQSTAVVAVFTASWTLVYSYLELLGLPHLTVGTVHALGWPVFVVAMVRLIVSGR
jgi:hypothetical protein